MAGALMVVLSLVDLVTNVLPLQFGELQWRYGAWGLLAGFLLTPVLGMFMLAAAAAVLVHGGALKTLWWINLAVSVVLVLGSVMFVLDVLQFRGAVPRGDLSRFDIGAAKALLKHVTVAAALFWLGRACRSAATRAATGRRGGGVLVGGPEG